MNQAEDFEHLLAYLNNELDDDKKAELLERLKCDSELRRRLLTLADEEICLHQWACSSVHAALSDACESDNLSAHTNEVSVMESSIHPTILRPGRRWPLIGRGSLALAAVLLPPLVLILSVYHFGDQGLALPEWSDSVNHIVNRATQYTASCIALAWVAGHFGGWLKHSTINGVAASVSLMIATAALQAGISDYEERELQRWELLFQDHRWVSYDSVFYWPKDLVDKIGHPAQEPTADQVRQELGVLHRAGFTGLYLHECRDTQVPRIAREVGFTAVVQGIRVSDPGTLESDETQHQISNAISVGPFVDAYCLGEFNAREVNLPALKIELARIRAKTSKPVTSSFIHDDSMGKRGERLRMLSDFTIRAFARPWTGSHADPDAAVAALQRALDSFRDDDKPSLLTAVVYPSGGGEGFSEHNQAVFFEKAKNLRVPRGVNIVYFNSFDRPWARKLSQVSTNVPGFEGHTGLFSYRGDDGSGNGEFIEKKAMSIIRSDTR